MRLLEITDAAFYTSLRFPTFNEPFLALLLWSGFGFVAWLRQNHMLDPQVIGKFIIESGIQPMISTGLFRWLAKGFDIFLQAWLSLVFIIGVAGKNSKIGHNTAISLIEPDFVTVFQLAGLDSLLDGFLRHVQQLLVLLFPASLASSVCLRRISPILRAVRRAAVLKSTTA